MLVRMGNIGEEEEEIELVPQRELDPDEAPVESPPVPVTAPAAPVPA